MGIKLLGIVLDTTGRQAIPKLPDLPPGADLGPEIRPLQSFAEPLAPSKDPWQLLAPNNRGVPEEAVSLKRQIRNRISACSVPIERQRKPG